MASATIPHGYTGNLRAARKRIGMTLSAVGNVGTALSSALNGGNIGGVDSLRFGYNSPADSTTHPAGSRLTQYDMGWMVYNNSIFDTWALMQGGYSYAAATKQANGYGFYPWGIYLSKRGLYAKTMSLYNPVRRLVDFYVSHVFPGVLSEDGSQLPDGMALAIPLSRDTDPRLRAAIAQGWFWGNWQMTKGLWLRMCAATGDGPVEIIDDVEAGNVYAEPVWPGEITEVQFSGRRNVAAYTRVQRVLDEGGQPFQLARVVTADTIRTFRDGQPFEYRGMPSEYDNPYGFAPLVWNSHIYVKTIPGGMAVRNWNQIERLNSLASRLYRYLERQARTPMLLPSQQEVSKISIDAQAEEEVQLLTTSGAGGIESLAGNLDLAGTEARLLSLIQEMEANHPEVVMYQALRGMSQVTGPAAEALMGDVAGYLNDARAGYDSAEIRKNQMLVAIGGMRYSEGKGGWKARNAQQKRFAPFGLESYARGDLEHSIDPRPLMQQSREQQAQSKLAVMTAIGAGINAEMPVDFQMGEFGENWAPEQLAAWRKAQDEQAARDTANAQAMQPQGLPQLMDGNAPDAAAPDAKQVANQ